ncbi:hypothetical protein CAC42_2709 [Sphaceloma murrayae]|uniref:Uncharacterized protein n=1 Tax=Sphaceloma murrayae TaxID=2082308 RepID=A0A2K1R0F3_9PEZI|nr:hypothetical protein CAC42_2709 [Sphaceloma murrayae]
MPLMHFERKLDPIIRPFKLIGLNAHVEQRPGEHGKPKPFWLIEFTVVPERCFESIMSVETHQVRIAAEGPDHPFPPDLAAFHVECNVFTRTWSDGRVAAGLFMDNLHGVEVFRFGFARMAVEKHTEEMIMSGDVQLEWPELDFYDWYTTPRPPEVSRAEFAHRVYMTIEISSHFSPEDKERADYEIE